MHPLAPTRWLLRFIMPDVNATLITPGSLCCLSSYHFSLLKKEVVEERNMYHGGLVSDS